MRRTSKLQFVQVDRKGASGQICVNITQTFFSFVNLSCHRLTEVTLGGFWIEWQNFTRGCAFWGSVRWPPNFPQNTQKWGVVMKFQAISEQRENIKKSSKLSDIFEWNLTRYYP